MWSMGRVGGILIGYMVHEATLAGLKWLILTAMAASTMAIAVRDLNMPLWSQKVHDE